MNFIDAIWNRAMIDGTSSAGKFCHNRVTEWILAGCLLWWGVATLMYPETITVGSFRYLSLPEGLGIHWGVFGGFNLLFGVSWVAALLYNGHGLPWTARIRALCAAVCAVILFYMSLCLAFITKDTGAPSLGIGSHWFWCLGAMYSCLRAGIDVYDEVYAKSPVTVAIFDGDANPNGKSGLGAVPNLAIIRGDHGPSDIRPMYANLRQSEPVPKTG